MLSVSREAREGVVVSLTPDQLRELADRGGLNLRVLVSSIMSRTKVRLAFHATTPAGECDRASCPILREELLPSSDSTAATI